MPESSDEPPGGNSPFRDIPEILWNDWKWQLKNTVSTLPALKKFIALTPDFSERLEPVLAAYPFSVPPYYFSLIDFEDPCDPLRLQAFPDPQEKEFFRIGEKDPLEEETDMPVPGLIHRYPDRVLMQVTDMCPMLCRHCTRKREWEKGMWTRSNDELERMYAYLEKTRTVRDVLISGGDPLMLAAKRLDAILGRLRLIPHIEIIRIGTRFPVVLPQRIDEELVGVLRKHRPLWLHTHFNHPKEITRESQSACDRILCAGIPVNNQTVLLKGVNDTVATMTRLCHGLVKMGVRPYYLYQCDPVKGAEHFRTSVWKGIEIIEGMRGHTSGFAVPTFVIDAPGGGGKIPMQPDYFLAGGEDWATLRNYEGFVFRYSFPDDKSIPCDNEAPVWKTFSERLARREQTRPFCSADPK
ncbi:MAG TPA: KamA family radical SAM protein [Candidatus Omnitrophota bacterium]|nr:KamA family radical SAM protein [Candidatus Omnitrophota bacterium]